MTISISRDLSLFNFERLDILQTRIGHPYEMLWPFKFLENFRCSISSVSIYYKPESDIRMKCCDPLNFSRAFVVQFWESWYIVSPNRTPGSKVMTIWIYREVPLFNFGVSIYYAPESDIRVKSYDQLNFWRASVVQFRASEYIMSPNQTSEWKVMIIWISRAAPFFNFERLDILRSRSAHPCEKWWQFQFLVSFGYSISNVSIYYDPESDIRVKSYDHLNSSRGFILQFRRLDILFALIGHPCEKLWPIKFLESFCCSISGVLIYFVPKSSILVKRYSHLNFFRTFVFNFERLDILRSCIVHSCEKLWPFKFLESFRCSISSVLIYYTLNRTSVWKVMTI